MLDDDGQNPPAEVLKLYNVCKEKGFDVVYGKYETKRHNIFRNLGSMFNDKAANLMLKKPKSPLEVLVMNSKILIQI